MTVHDDLDWIAVQGGASRLRAWAVAADGTVLAEAHSEDGMAAPGGPAFEPALLALIGPWLRGRTPILACGTDAAGQGPAQTPYTPIPAKPAALHPIPATGLADPRLDLWIVPGLSQVTPPDILCGQEILIAGLLAHDPQFDGILVLPAPQTTWAHLSAEEVVSFQTCMTGETFGLMSRGSLLRPVVTADSLDHDAFLDAVSDSLSRPERLAARLSSIRADATLNALAPAVARARLSGALIGAELAVTRPYWLGQQVVIAGHGELATLYGAALSAQGVAAQVIAADPLTLRGLAGMRAALPNRRPM
jgi:2-dehydro-3-deoxygalactonokinase